MALPDVALTLPLSAKELHALASFSFMSEIDLMMMIRECFAEPEYACGEIILSQVRSAERDRLGEYNWK